jgi:IclR family acetate operon transcriptional repressor
MSTHDQADSGHRTAGRVLDILECLAMAPQGSALRDLSRILDAPKSSLLPLLRTLVGRGYASRDANGLYRLGAMVLQLGSGSLDGMDLRDIARPLLAALTQRTGESTILATLTSDEHSVVYIDKVEGTHRIRATASVGETRPLHSTSSGKVLLAWMPKEQREAVIRSLRLTRLTEYTITTKAALRAELDRVHREGVCINADQSVVGHCTVAAPILDRDGHAVAACVLSAPKERIWAALPRVVKDVKATAASISALLGHSRPTD